MIPEHLRDKTCCPFCRSDELELYGNRPGEVPFVGCMGCGWAGRSGIPLPARWVSLRDGRVWDRPAEGQESLRTGLLDLA